MSRERTIVIGGNAGGMSAAAQLRRLDEDMEIIVFEKGPHTSYSSCGIPYYIGHTVDDWSRMISRTPEEFRKSGVQAWTLHEVTRIDVKEKIVEVHDILSGKKFPERWDKLLIATGATPIRPPMPGADAEGVFGVSTLDSGIQIRRWMEEHKPAKAAIVGGGYIGLEMAEAMNCHLGLDTSVVERAPQVMGTLDADMAKYIAEDMTERGYKLFLGESIEEFLTKDGRLIGVKTDKRELEADIAIMGLGVRANTTLAAEAGIVLGDKGAIVVDKGMRTSAPDVWAAGDCALSTNILTGKPMYIALGTVANKHGRVAAFTMAGMDAECPGVLGTAVCKICKFEIARTGRLEREMISDNIPHICGIIESSTRAAYMEGAGSMCVKLVVELPSKKIVGAQVVGTEDAAKRIDTLATAITTGLTVDDVVNLDLSYAPPFSPVWDPVQQAARYVQGQIRKKNS